MTAMADPARQTVLVTGADGFIGSHLVEALVEAGAAVRAMVMYTASGQWGWLDSLPAGVRDAIEVVPADIRDRSAVLQAVRGCDTLFHLAALISIPYSYRAPESYVDTNIRGTLNLLEAARTHGTGRFVHTSTSEVYGSARRVPIDEDHPLNAQSPYAATKIAADQLALSYHRSFGLPVSVLRPFNTYGPRQSTRAVIPTIITQIARGQRHLRLGSLHPTRDFSFVTDTVAAFLTLARHEKGIGQLVNAGSGFEISIADTAHLIAEVMQAEVTLTQDEARIRPEASEVDRLYADIDRAQTLIGWSPEHGGRAGFRTGLEKTAAWFADPANLAHYPREGYQV